MATDNIDDRIEDLSNQVSKLSLINKPPPTMSQLKERQTELFPISLDFHLIKNVRSQPKTRARGLIGYNGVEEDVDISGSSSVSIISKPISTTPSKNATTKGQVESRRAWLTGWLIMTNMFYCHISHVEPCARLYVQYAHVLLPQSQLTNRLMVSNGLYHLLDIAN